MEILLLFFHHTFKNTIHGLNECLVGLTDLFHHLSSNGSYKLHFCKQYRQRACIHKLFCKRTYLYQITIGVGHIAGALSPRLSGGRKNGGSAIRERMLVFLVDIGEGGHVECQFYCTVEPLGILKFPSDHLFESVTWEEDDAHFTQRHLHVRLDAVPIGGESEGLRVEIDSRFVVAGENPHGVEFESIHCYFFIFFIFTPGQ